MIRAERLLETFLDLVRIPSPPGQEEAVAAAVSERLRQLGLEAQRDETGNLLARLAGEGEPLLLTAHLDTVTPCEGVQPVVRDGVVRSDGTTILGADNKAGVAAILELLAALRENREAHRPIEVLFTVREEVGLEGAKAFDTGQLRARLGIGLDAGGEPGTVVVQAPAQNSWEADVLGRMAHAGANPEEGINAIRVAAEGVAAMPMGRLDADTTANVGVISGGTATNIVPDRVHLKGEVRSHSEERLEAQTAAMEGALRRAAEAHGGAVDWRVRRAYSAYRLSEEAAVVRLVSAAWRSLGIEPLLVPTGGGSDANVLNLAGIETVQVTTGMRKVHTLEEEIGLDDLMLAARVLWACVT